jgi:hypothetical protein
MSWAASIFISILSGALGLICAGVIGQLCTGWYRVSTFEGAAGYFVVSIAILGGLASLAIGGIAARFAGPEFFKALGLALGTVLGIALVALAICRLCADLAPTMDGKSLELEIEVRCPKGFQVPPPDAYGAHAGVYLPRGRRLPTAKLRLDETKTIDGQLVVPAVVPLTTSSSRKYLNVRFNQQHDLLFSLPLRAHPKTSDREWSSWVASGWNAGKPEPPPEAKFYARYRARMVEPPPPEPDPEEVRAKEFAALTADAPLEQWLPFLFESPADDRSKVVIQRIQERQVELAQLIRSTNETMREYALRAAEYPAKPAEEIKEAVLAEGRDIAAGIRKFNQMSADDPKFHDVLLDLRTRFNYWKQAWWTIHQRLGVDGRPPVQEICDLATVRARGTAMDEIEVNARVILEALNKSPAEKKP